MRAPPSCATRSRLQTGTGAAHHTPIRPAAGVNGKAANLLPGRPLDGPPMNQPTANNSEPPRRNFETDAPRADLTPGHKPVNNKLWAGMAGAFVVASVSIASLTGSAATTPGAAAPAGAITTADSTVVRVARPLAPAPLDEPSAGATVPETVDPASVPTPAAARAKAPAPPAPKPAPTSRTNLYTVVPGDTVGAIATRHGVDMNAMLAANGLNAYSIIVPGQTLKLTGPAVAVSAPAPAQAPAPAACCGTGGRTGPCPCRGSRGAGRPCGPYHLRGRCRWAVYG